MNRSMFRYRSENTDMVTHMALKMVNTWQPALPKAHRSKAEVMAAIESTTKPTKRSYTASDVMRTLVLSAKLVTRRVTVMERILPATMSSPRRVMKQVRRAMMAGDRSDLPMEVELSIFEPSGSFEFGLL